MKLEQWSWWEREGQTCVSISVKWACFLLLERLADSLLESILKRHQLNKLNRIDYDKDVYEKHQNNPLVEKMDRIINMGYGFYMHGIEHQQTPCFMNHTGLYLNTLSHWKCTRYKSEHKGKGTKAIILK